MSITIDITTITVLIVIIVVLIVFFFLLWTNQNKRKEKNLRIELQNQYAKSSKLAFNEICSSGKGEIHGEGDDKTCIISLPDTKRIVSAAIIENGIYHFWTRTDDEKALEKESYEEGPKIEIKIINDDNESYLIDKIVHTYDNKSGEIKKEPKITAFITQKLIDNGDIKKKYQLIYTCDGKIDVIWFNDFDSAKIKIITMMNMICNMKIKITKENINSLSVTKHNCEYNITKYSAALKTKDAQHNWLIVEI